MTIIPASIINKDDFKFIIPYVEFRKDVQGQTPLVLDTSKSYRATDTSEGLDNRMGFTTPSRESNSHPISSTIIGIRK